MGSVRRMAFFESFLAEPSRCLRFPTTERGVPLLQNTNIPLTDLDLLETGLWAWDSPGLRTDLADHPFSKGLQMTQGFPQLSTLGLPCQIRREEFCYKIRNNSSLRCRRINGFTGRRGKKCRGVGDRI